MLESEWTHVIGVLKIGNREASQYVGMVVRLNKGNMQIRSNVPHAFNVTASGVAELALMDGDFVEQLRVEVGQVSIGNRVEALT